MNSQRVLPVFDLDDLAFLHVYGIGLRHVDQATYEKEVVKGGHGDAVSLANFGLGKALDIFDDSIQPPCHDYCETLQVKIERFIVGCHQSFHTVADHYNDVAYLFMQRGGDARDPYDFKAYPLGKCGKKPFDVDIIMSSFSTCHFQNDNIKHANLNVFNELIKRMRALKLRCAREVREVLSARPEMVELCERFTKLIELYEANVYLPQPFFASLLKECLQDDEFANHSIAKNIEVYGNFYIDRGDFDCALAEVNAHACKGSEPLEIFYEPFNCEAASTSGLITHLVYAIQQENESDVRAVLAELSARSVTSLMGVEDENIIRNAARSSSVTILKMVYAFDPVIWRQVKQARPFFHAANSLRLESLQFLFSCLSLTPLDLLLDDTHIYSLPSLCHGLDNGMEIVRLLLSKQVPIGNETLQLYKNPVASVAGSYEIKNKKEVLALLLPHANAESKYAGLMRAILELYYLYRDGRNIIADNQNTDAMFLAVNMIFSSLSPSECSEIRKIFAAKKPQDYSTSEKMLFINVEFKCKLLKMADEGVFDKIKLCFHPLPQEARLPSLSNPLTLYRMNHSNPGSDEECSPHHSCQIKK